MGDTLVLANLEVDTSGAVRSMAGMNAAVIGSGTQLEVFAGKAASTGGFLSTLFGRMTNLRIGALALGRALGLAGILTTVAFAVVALVKDLITGTEWFKNIKEATTDWWMAVAHGEEAVDRLARKMDETSKGAGFTSIFTMIEQVKKLEAAFSETFERRAGTMGGGALFHALTLDLDTIGRQINDLLDKLQKAGFGRDELIGLTGGIHRKVGVGSGADPFAKPGPTPFETFGILTPEKMRETIALAREAQQVFIRMGAADPLFPLDRALQSIHDKLISIGLTKEQIEKLGLAFTKVTAEAKPFEEMILQAEKHFTKAQFAAEAMTMGIEAMGSAMTEALVGGGTSFREAMADMMKSLAQMAFVYALWNLALGIMASTPWGAAIGLGPPSTYFKAAAAFGAVGVAAAGAARALGSGAAASSGSGGGAATGQAIAAGGGNTYLNVTFAGPTFGFNEAAFARYVTDIQLRGERTS